MNVGFKARIPGSTQPVREFVPFVFRQLPFRVRHRQCPQPFGGSGTEFRIRRPQFRKKQPNRMIHQVFRVFGLKVIPRRITRWTTQNR